jgi:hypothetical protein
MPRGANPAAIRQSLLTEAFHHFHVDDYKGRPQTALQQNSLFSISPTIVSSPICVICVMLSTFSAFGLAGNPAAALNSNVAMEGDGWLSRELGG